MRDEVKTHWRQGKTWCFYWPTARLWVMLSAKLGVLYFDTFDELQQHLNTPIRIEVAQ